MEQLFFELIQVSLGTRLCLSHTPSVDEWGELYKLAKKQSLVGVCFAGVQKLQQQQQAPPEMLYLTWMGMTAKIQLRNGEVDRQCVEMQARLSADGFRSCVLKGQGVGQLYAEHLRGFRQSGDIDVWLDAPKEKVIEYGMKIKTTCEFDQKHMHYHCFDDTDVEAHWIPVKRNNPLWNRTLEKFFDSERERQFTNIVNGLCVPTADFQLVHQLLHMYSHFVYEGVGMRQMMDLYFAQKACSNGRDKVIALFKKLGLMKFVAATQWVLKEVFISTGSAQAMMPVEMLLCEPDAREGQKLLDEILIGGNFGKFDKRNHVKGETFTQRFFRRWGRKFRMIRFDLLGTILMPFMRVKLEIWMRRVRKKYNVKDD